MCASVGLRTIFVLVLVPYARRYLLHGSSIQAPEFLGDIPLAENSPLCECSSRGGGVKNGVGMGFIYRFSAVLGVLAGVCCFSLMAHAKSGSLQISSSSFKANRPIPLRHTCQGGDILAQGQLIGTYVKKKN